MLHGDVGIYLLYPSEINYPSLVRDKTHLYINKYSVSLKKALTWNWTSPTLDFSKRTCPKTKSMAPFIAKLALELEPKLG